jgi:predicted nuclease with RNAse H fold
MIPSESYMKAVGIDLAGVETRPTGFCVLGENLNTQTYLLHSDKEIIDMVEQASPDVVSIDAPLALPRDRPSLSAKYKNRSHLRECDKALLKMGIKFFPVTLGPMRKLTQRGMNLRKILEAKGFKVIESFPGAAQDILEIPRKQRGLQKLRQALIKYGIKGDAAKRAKSDHELDAVTSALVGLLYLEGNYVAIGDPEEVLMILPKAKAKKR